MTLMHIPDFYVYYKFNKQRRLCYAAQAMLYGRLCHVDPALRC